MQSQGKLIYIGPLQQPTPTFSKRDFAIEITEAGFAGDPYTYTLAFQLNNDKAGLLDSIQEGTEIIVSWNARSNKSEKDGNVRFFTNLNAWKVEKVGSNATQPQQSYPQQSPSTAQPQSNFAPGADDDLPF